MADGGGEIKKPKIIDRAKKQLKNNFGSGFFALPIVVFLAAWKKEKRNHRQKSHCRG
jgi:hypothetical protein